MLPHLEQTIRCIFYYYQPNTSTVYAFADSLESNELNRFELTVNLILCVRATSEAQVSLDDHVESVSHLPFHPRYQLCFIAPLCLTWYSGALHLFPTSDYGPISGIAVRGTLRTLLDLAREALYGEPDLLEWLEQMQQIPPLLKKSAVQMGSIHIAASILKFHT